MSLTVDIRNEQFVNSVFIFPAWGGILIPISHRCTELEGREWKKFFPIRSTINGKQRLSLIDRGQIPSILFLLILYTGVKWV